MEWVVQQLRETFPEAGPYRYVILGRDTKFDSAVITFLQSTDLTPKRTSVQAPWQNGISERWVGSCRREMLNHIIALNERHLHRLIRDYVSYRTASTTLWKRIRRIAGQSSQAITELNRDFKRPSWRPPSSVFLARSGVEPRGNHLSLRDSQGRHHRRCALGCSPHQARRSQGRWRRNLPEPFRWVSAKTVPAVCPLRPCGTVLVASSLPRNVAPCCGFGSGYAQRCHVLYVPRWDFPPRLQLGGKRRVPDRGGWTVSVRASAGLTGATGTA